MKPLLMGWTLSVVLVLGLALVVLAQEPCGPIDYEAQYSMNPVPL